MQNYIANTNWVGLDVQIRKSLCLQKRTLATMNEGAAFEMDGIQDCQAT